MIPDENLDRLDARITSGSVIRHSWTDGAERACLLASLVPECGEKQSAAACPASVIPPWLALLTPWIDDSGTDARWPDVVREYARILRASQWFTAEQWERLDFRARKCAVVEARKYGSEDVCDRVIALLDRAIEGNMPTQEQWSAARAAAEASWSATARVAAAAAEASWSAAETWSAEARVAAAAEASWSAAEASWSAEAAAEARVAEAAEADQIILAFFAEWQKEIDQCATS